MLLDICIPTYKRPEGAVRAARSALKEIRQSGYQSIQIVISEDCGNPGDYEFVQAALLDGDAVVIHRQTTNQGMSWNIYSMLISSTADYCFILTDDDWLNPGSLSHILKAIKDWNPEIIYGPRYSYTEDNTLYTIATDTFNGTRSIQGNPFACGLYCKNFFILSGLVIKRSQINYAIWELHRHNAFFPIIFGGSSLRNGVGLFLKTPLVHHTVLNVCHWESWGGTSQARHFRLAKDFFLSFSALASSYPVLIDRVAFQCGTFYARVDHLLVNLYSLLKYPSLSVMTLTFQYFKIFFSHPVNWFSLALLPAVVVHKSILKISRKMSF